MEMDDSSSRPLIGQIVKVLRGRDEGKFAVVIGYDGDRFVRIADGDKRKFDTPKKKNFIHIEPQEEIADEVVQSLSESGRVTNGKLRFVLQRYAEKINSDTPTRKGD